MLDTLRNLFSRKPPLQALRGKPKIRREKNYSSESGYVYQYFHEGYREVERGAEAGREFIFEVSADRASRFPTRVFLSRSALDQWRRANGRELSPTEQYAIVKLSLFEAFDQASTPASGPLELRVTAEDVARHAETLDL